MITTTLKRIQEHRPCQNGWKKLLNGLGKKKTDCEPLSFATILEINGLDDALWCCRVEPQYAREWRLFVVACVRRVEYLNPDPRVKQAIDVAERYANGEATDVELSAARDAAWAAWYAARAEGDAARAAAWAAWGAGGDAERDAARAARAALAIAWAAWDASGAATQSFAMAAAKPSGDVPEDAAKAAEWFAAWDAEREWQKKEFLRVVTETEVRAATASKGRMSDEI